MADAMRREGLPLFTLESWRPVREADLLGITLQAELTYSNVLEVLDLAGIPLRAADRGEGDPIVVAGGPSASNPAPLTPFFDAFFMGESEEAFEQVLDVDRGAPTGRAARLAALAENPYLYVPERGRRDGATVRSTPSSGSRPSRSRSSCRTRRRSSRGPRSRSCAAAPAAAASATPARGTGRCASGPPTQVIEAGLAQLRCTGYDELSLTSLATSDYTDVVPAIEGIKERMPDLHLSLPSNRVDTGPVAMTAAANARQSSITLAPEAATQRMRDIICKTITDEMIENAIAAAFQAGYTQPQDVLHDRPAARDARRGAGHRRSRHPGARDRPEVLGGGRFSCT